MVTDIDACAAYADFRENQNAEPFLALLDEKVQYLSKWDRFNNAVELGQWLVKHSTRQREPRTYEYHAGILIDDKGAENPCVFMTSLTTGRIENITFLYVDAGKVVKMSYMDCPNYYPPFHRDGNRIWEGEWRKDPLTRAEYDAMQPVQRAIVDALDVPVVERAAPPRRTH